MEQDQDKKESNNVKEYFPEFFADLFDSYRMNNDGTFKSQDEAAQEIGISKASLSQYINEGREPKISSLMKISQFFKVSPNKLLGYEEDQERDTHAIDASHYTGLSLEAIELLHKSRNNFLRVECLSYLLESEKFLDIIVEYLLSSLHDDVAADERYNLLPGAKKKSEEEGKPFYYDIIGSLPMLREHFHQSAINTKQMFKKYVSEMAMRCIDHREVYRQYFPYISYRPELSPQDAYQLNKSAEEESEAEVSAFLENTSVDDFFQILNNPEHDSHSILKPHFYNAHDEQVLYDDQAENYLNEYYAYYSNMK